ncbi:MAG: Gfo/Idh/MocA family oxidoreductase [Dehalococcoidia bacterium]
MAENGLRIGVVGVGFGTSVHVPGFRSEGWEVNAICSRTEEHVIKAAAEFDIPNKTTDYRELVARDDIDAVAIVTPPSTHAEITLAALDAGKHVLCEKPFVMSEAEAANLRDAVAAKGLTGMITHEFRFTPQRSHLKELLDQGYVGEVQTVNVEGNVSFGRPDAPPPLTWQGQSAMGGGTIGGLGSHYIDTLRYWLGELASVSAETATLRPQRTDPSTGAIVLTDTEDSFAMTMRFKSGALGTFAWTTSAPVSLGVRITIQGTEGVLCAPQARVNPDTAAVVYGAKAGESELKPLPMPERLTPFVDDRDGRLAPFRLLVRQFERGIREGTSPSPNFEDGLRTQQVMDAINKSAATGERVTLNL